MIAKVEHRTRKPHGAKCDYCKTRHGDGAPWWNVNKNGWSITLRTGGKARNRLLAKGWEGHDEAIRIWKQQTTHETAARALTSLDDGDGMTVEQLVHHRLEYLKNYTGESNYTNNKAYLNDFCYHREYGFATTTIREIRNGGIARIKQWVNAHRWNDSSKAGAYAAVKSLFNFAIRGNEDGPGIIDSSPIAKLNTGRNRVQTKIRLEIFTPEQEAAILNNSNPRGIHPQFGLAFRVLVATGARPDEFCSLTGNDVRRDPNGELYWWINHKNIKRTKQKRRVYLTPEMQRVTVEHFEKYAADRPIFRNCWGQPWDVDSLLAALRRVTKRHACAQLGLDEYEEGMRTDGTKKRNYSFVMYTCPPYFCISPPTGFYKRPDGTPLVLNYGEVGALMGNKAAEVERTYGHLVKATTFLSGLVNHD